MVNITTENEGTIALPMWRNSEKANKIGSRYDFSIRRRDLKIH